MSGKPNYDSPSRDDLLNLINYEGVLVQIQEQMEEHNQHDEVRVIKRERQLVRNRKVCLKAALDRVKRNYVRPMLFDELPSMI